PHGLDIAVRTGAPIRSIDHSRQMEFSFRPISDSGIVPLTAADTGNKKEKNPHTLKTQQPEASRPPNFGGHGFLSKNQSPKTCGHSITARIRVTLSSASNSEFHDLIRSLLELSPLRQRTGPASDNSRRDLMRSWN